MGERRVGETEGDRRKIERFSDSRIRSGIEATKKYVFISICLLSASSLALLIKGFMSGISNVGFYFFGSFFLIFFSVILFRCFASMRLFVNNESINNLQKVVDKELGLFLTISMVSFVVFLYCLVIHFG